MKKVHLIGMGGIGMSALAQLLIEQGVKVTGSDTGSNGLVEKVRRLGGEVCLGHRASNLDHPDLVVYSSAVSSSNPELVAARNREIPVVHRGRLLARLVAGRRTLAVAGSHGKSTTSGMTAQILTAAGLDPMLALGAEIESLGGNARSGRGRTAVVEADESDNSFLWLTPRVAVVTNIDEEHLDYFRNRREIQEAYRIFAERIEPNGCLIACIDDAGVRALFAQVQCRRISYGFSRRAFWRAIGLRLEPGGSRFRCVRGGRTAGTVRLAVPGRHNVANALAALAAGEEAGVSFSTMARALAAYRGAQRRFQIHGEKAGVMVVEDYGHHPAEIEATLAAAAAWKTRRIRCVFQPHRYSRTHHLLDRFRGCFAGAQELILLPVYAASEEPVAGATSAALARVLSQPARKKILVRTPDQALAHLKKTAVAGDLVLFLGAGSVGSMARKFFEQLAVRPELVEGRTGNR